MDERINLVGGLAHGVPGRRTMLSPGRRASTGDWGDRVAPGPGPRVGWGTPPPVNSPRGQGTRGWGRDEGVGTYHLRFEVRGTWVTRHLRSVSGEVSGRLGLSGEVWGRLG